MESNIDIEAEWLALQAEQELIIVNSPVHLNEDPRLAQKSTVSLDPRDQLGVIDNPIKSEWEKLDFESPAELITYFHPTLNNHVDTLHPWQVEISDELAKAKCSSKHPYKYCLCAANGSGKDAFVIAPFALWFITTKIRSLVVITSSSGVQLSHQTENYIRSLGQLMNNFYRQVYNKEILKINQRSIKCLLSGSEIVMFSTDEEGRAEGYHPLEPGAEMAIVVNEAKTVPPPIFRALNRCTGFNYWLNVSTPGEPQGDFYYSFTHWPHKRRITFYDCPHQSPDQFEEDRHQFGEHSLLFRSKWLALFTSISGNTVISQLSIEKLRNRLNEGHVEWVGRDWPIRVGIDLAAGGDETVLSVWRGNKQIDQIAFREEDTTRGADKIEQGLLKHRLPKDHNYIFADDGGIGKAIIQMLQKKGWSIKRVLNNSAAKNQKKDFKNRGAELWTKFARFIELCYLIPLDDEKLWAQLASRHYRRSTEAAIVKIQLESKAAEIAEGFKSPDRGDAAILAFTDVTVDMLQKAVDGIGEDSRQDSTKLSRDEMLIQVEDMMYAGELANNMRGGKSNINPIGALSAIIKQQSKNYGTRYRFTGTNKW